MLPFCRVLEAILFPGRSGPLPRAQRILLLECDLLWIPIKGCKIIHDLLEVSTDSHGGLRVLI